MNSSNFTDIVIYLVIGIATVGILGSLTKSRFLRTTHKDEFRNRKQIGQQNLGKVKKQKTYSEVVKDRGLKEAKKLDPKMNPKVTRSLTVTSKDIRKTDNR